jgi:hypothetical protein
MQDKKENSTSPDYGKPTLIGLPSKGIARFVRFAGRVCLWGCVLLLLVRGIASYLGSDSHPASSRRGATMTVTRSAIPVPPTGRGR